MTEALISHDTPYKASTGVVSIVDVPEMGYVFVEGAGDPDSPVFAQAVQALYGVSYAARFLIKKEYGEASKVMPLEALWWVDEGEQDILAAAALPEASSADRALWMWRSMIMQPAPIDEGVIARAVERARAKSLTALERVRFQRWEEGRCAQILHVGPYAAEGPTIRALHAGITAAGYRPRGRHHEIYLGDPRRGAPETLRTILRHPVERRLS